MHTVVYANYGKKFTIGVIKDRGEANVEYCGIINLIRIGNTPSRVA